MNLLNHPQKQAIHDAHGHLSKLIFEYNRFEITTHNWEAVQALVLNMEKLFDFVPKSGVELTRDFHEKKN